MSRWITGLIVTIVLGIPAAALADATVQVRLTDSAGRPTDGTVTVTGQAQTRTCVTTAGRCTITLRAGTYTATVAPRRGTAPPPRSLTVPAAGTVTLALAIGPPPASTGTTITSGTSTVTATAPGTAIAPRPATRNLGTGTRLVVSGQVQDAAGRPTDGTVTVLQGAQTIGTATTTAGRFSLFDLAAGAYTVQVTTRLNRTGRGSVTVGAATARITVRIP
jgi:hypothetical protein